MERCTIEIYEICMQFDKRRSRTEHYKTLNQIVQLLSNWVIVLRSHKLDWWDVRDARKHEPALAKVSQTIYFPMPPKTFEVSRMACMARLFRLVDFLVII